ncbi:MAG: Lrp/AsnC family transcriptional regulator [Gammaproteobacteria bacterium]|nr:Lrp/AsnC family transcriptional regulator [Gammaproteobacteria bacterium]MDE0252164.1 Lrp/AsnC family transcriptional regulator [Gammaproteobacteria bacterium]MDE0402727.1 Lrp/AsnC family transcriptional regulator [Gammaproteobacteria bacterium]
MKLTKVKIDKLDYKIMEQVQTDASISIQELAERVGLSSTACWRRLRKMENEGVIRKTVAILNPRHVKLSVNVFANIRLKDHSQESLRHFEKAIEHVPEVVECYSVTGENDFLLRVVVKDVEAYEELLNKKLINLFEVSSYKSMFALRQIKYQTELPLSKSGFHDQ